MAKWKKSARLSKEARWKMKEQLKTVTAERDRLRDKALKLEAVCNELGKHATAHLVRAGIEATHEDCPKCKTRGFTNGVACEECGGVGRRKLENVVMRKELANSSSFSR